ncbi:hypothetical protein AB4Z32_02135 [Massilia sp. 2TAF26]|uniref:hypothetical protein n=1 Tax=Massilia sp. 2TAF26 TaxID=3233012 RepID=UPI003F99A16C
MRTQDDFVEHLNGKWLKTAEIPADKSSWGSFMELRENTQPQLRAIIEKAAAQHAAKGTDEQRIGDCYTSFMDEARVEQLGVNREHNFAQVGYWIRQSQQGQGIAPRALGMIAGFGDIMPTAA